ncbi:MAG: PD40 domain-containing protein [Bacteroidales bacterium]|nr:PD40 domain-containing protein [Bacteroidales bacterium]
MNKLALSILILFIVLQVDAQTGKLSTSNKRAIELYLKATESYQRYDTESAILFLNQSIEKDSKFIEAYLILSQIYQEMRLVDNAIDAANKAIAINPDFFPNIYFNLGNLFLFKGEYETSLSNFNKFLGYQTIKPQIKRVAERRKATCEFAIKAIQNPVPFNPINLGLNVNSSYDEYWPSLSADENTLVITANIPKDSSLNQVIHNRQEDFFITHRNSEGKWEPIKPVGKPLNTPFNEGAQSITSDGKKMYYTVCRGVCNIFSSELTPDGTWSAPTRLSTINSNKFSNKQPSISPDGRTLYFVSNRPGGYGGFDIYKTTLKDDGSWSTPKNLGNTINTEGEEQSPFIHFDNQTLYFASDGHVGMGGLDLFVSRLSSDSTWSIPKNLGYPINTYRDEDGLIVNARGTTAYYSSDRDPQHGRDIFTFDLDPSIQPIPASYLTGTIKDSENGKPLKANFSLVDLTTEHVIMKSLSSDDGGYLVCIPTEKSYALYASATGYLFFSDHFELKGTHSIDKPFRKDIALDPIKVNQIMQMRNIFFETDSYALKSESKVELNKLLDLLLTNKTIRIEVGGHTDSQGDNAYNQKLSENRAKSVVDYLIAHQIAPERVKWVGYGETKPIADNKTEEGRSLNRRTEVKITGI